MKKYNNKGLIKFTEAYYAVPTVNPEVRGVFYKGQETYKKIMNANKEIAESMGAKNVGEIYNSSKYSVEEFYRKCSEKYWKDLHLFKVKPIIEIKPGTLNIKYTNEDYLAAVYHWQCYILECVQNRLNNSIVNRDKRIEDILNGKIDWSNDCAEIYSREEYEKIDKENRWNLDDDTVFSVVHKEVNRVKAKYVSNEELFTINEILSIWKQDIEKSYEILSNRQEGNQNI